MTSRVGAASGRVVWPCHDDENDKGGTTRHATQGTWAEPHILKISHNASEHYGTIQCWNVLERAAEYAICVTYSYSLHVRKFECGGCYILSAVVYAFQHSNSCTAGGFEREAGEV